MGWSIYDNLFLRQWKKVPPAHVQRVCVVFLCVGGIGEVTPLLTLSSRLRYVGVFLGGDGNCHQKL
jgi:hypothetical protein